MRNELVVTLEQVPGAKCHAPTKDVLILLRERLHEFGWGLSWLHCDLADQPPTNGADEAAGEGAGEGDYDDDTDYDDGNDCDMSYDADYDADYDANEDANIMDRVRERYGYDDDCANGNGNHTGNSDDDG